jgi:uncharacterized delta-60 repeat protein
MSRLAARLGFRARIDSLEPRRLLAVAGTLDPDFSGDGKATLSVFGSNAVDVAVQTDGKTVVVGTRTDPSGNIFPTLARYLPDGQPDPSFAGIGVVSHFIPSADDERLEAVAIAPDGKIVVTGTAEVGVGGGGGGFEEHEVLVMRFNTDGTIDNSFSDDGRIFLDLGDASSDTEGFDLAVQPDGKIVVVGMAYKIPDWDFFAMRLTVDGSLDRDIPNPFGGPLLYQGWAFDGVDHIGFGGNDEARAVKLDSAGNVYVTGIGNIGGNIFTGITKLTPNGTFAGSFDNDGKANFQVPGRTRTFVEDLIVQSGGRVVIAGHAVNPANNQSDFFVARFTADGQLDTTFGEQGGYTLTDLGGHDVVAGMIATPAGGGGGFIVSGGSGGFAAVKYTENGLLDTSFGTGGNMRLPGFGGTANIAPGPGRRFVLAGGANYATARVLLNGAREVNAFALDATAAEGSTNTGSLFVARTERLPYATRVLFNVGGTAVFSSTRGGVRDYFMSGLSLPTLIGGTGVVTIPANQTSVTVTLTTVNDSLREGTESASFGIVASSAYEVSSPSAGTISIKDDDTINFTVGTTTVDLPPKQVGVSQELQAAVTWTVPEGGWRQLNTIQLRLRDRKDGDALAILTFDEATNSFSVEATPGADSSLSLVLDKCRFVADGADAPTVTVIFTFVVNTAAANTRFHVDVAATNDSDAFSGFTTIGELHVHKKPQGEVGVLALPLV